MNTLIIVSIALAFAMGVIVGIFVSLGVAIMAAYEAMTAKRIGEDQ